MTSSTQIGSVKTAPPLGKIVRPEFSKHTIIVRSERGPNLPKPGLNNLIKELELSGFKDSSGVFTLSEEKAREKLSRYQMVEPRLYITVLLSTAVLNGATRFHLEQEMNKTEVLFDGGTFSREELENLWNQLISPTSPVLHELAVALNGARRIKGAKITFLSGECRIHVRGEEFELGRAEESETGLHRFCLTEPYKPRRLARWFYPGLQEARYLSSAATLAPLNLLVNSKNLSEAVKVGHLSPTLLAWLHLKGSKEKPEVIPPESSWSPHCVKTEQDGESTGLEAVLALDDAWTARENGLLIVNNGLTFQRSDAVLEVPFAHGVVWTELKKNASQTDLVEDADYLQLIGKLSRAAEDLVLHRLDSERRIPAEALPAWLSYAPKLGESLRRRGLAEEAFRVELWVKEHRYLSELKNKKHWRNLLQQLAHTEKAEQRHRVAERLKRAVTQAAEDALADRRLPDLHIHLSNLEELGRQEGWTLDWPPRCRFLCGLLSGIREVEIPPPKFSGLRVKRFLGRYVAALSLTEDPLIRTEILVAQGRFSDAEPYLQEILQRDRSLHASSTLSDLFAYSSHKWPSSLVRETLKHRETAIEGQSYKHFTWRGFLFHDLLQCARGQVSFPTWIRLRATASLSEPLTQPAAQEVEKRLLKAENEILQSGPMGVVVNSVLLQAERKIPIGHPFLEAVYLRCARLLRKRGDWAGADQLLARKALLEELDEAFDEKQA